ncbi:MAG: DUF1700 domain-containing protein [Clostridia bacterium]|nr:DUF1700 domain-containing protein [Clostridia bacterium]
MTRIEFREALSRRLSALSEEERRKSLDYYDEIICDRMEDSSTEDGLSEAEAVAALGDIDKIAAEILGNTPASDRTAAKKSRTWLWITLAIVGSPIWLSLLLAAAIVAFSLFIVGWSLVVTVGVLLVSLAVVGVVGIGWGIVSLAATPAYALVVLGIALASLGLAILAVPLTVLCVRGIVWLTKKLGRLCARPFRR